MRWIGALAVVLAGCAPGESVLVVDVEGPTINGIANLAVTVVNAQRTAGPYTVPVQSIPTRFSLGFRADGEGDMLVRVEARDAFGNALAAGSARETIAPSGSYQTKVTLLDAKVPLNASNRKLKVDVLFVVDDSPGTAQGAIRFRAALELPTLFDKLGQLAQTGTNLDLRLGVVTTDLGVGTGAPMSLGQCPAFPGNGAGRLVPIGKAASPTCQPPMGKPYIEYVFGGSNNLPAGQDVRATLGCMFAVGDVGCGFEAPLEAARLALLSPFNDGFVREDALLVVVFLSSEDDCSAPPDSDLGGTDADTLGLLASYRCTRFGIVCGDPPVPPPYGQGGTLSNCRPAPEGRLFGTDRYTTFFASPSGIKRDPRDVVLIGLTAPISPVTARLASPIDQTPCTTLDQMTCTMQLAPSCEDANITGDPPIRLDAVIQAAVNHSGASICDRSYVSAMASAGHRIGQQLSLGCVDLPLDAMNRPVASCLVEDVTLTPGGTPQYVELPACSAGLFPCWRIERTDPCAIFDDAGSTIVVDRGGNQVPPYTTTRAFCAGR